MTVNYKPDTKVEIAFNAGFRTASASYVWTDVSDYAELSDGVDIGYGRADELSTADANSLTVSLDNTDGRFTWGNAASPYYPNIKIGKPIRVTVTLPTSGTVTRYTGFVNEWPTEWPTGGQEYAKAVVSAASRLSRLGLNSPFKSVVEETVLPTAPLAYWICNEPSGATFANDSSGNHAPDLAKHSASGVTFGNATGPSTDGYAALSLNGGTVRGSHPTVVTDAPGEVVGIGMFVRVDPAAVTLATIFTWSAAGGYEAFIRIGGTGSVTTPLTSASLTGPTLDDDATHHIFLTVADDGVNIDIELYVDGVLEDTASLFGGAADFFQASTLRVGSSDFVGTIAHVTVYDVAPSAAEIAAIAEAGLTGFEGDTTDERLDRYAEWAGIPAAEVTSSASAVTLDHIDSNGVQAVEMMRRVESAEAGVLHDARDGKLTLRARSARYGASVAVTLDASSERVGLDYVPKVDRSALANVGTGQNADGTVTASYDDADSREEYGDAAYSVETAAQDAGEPLARVSWHINSYAEPRPRAPQVTIDLLPYLAEASDTLASILALDIGSKVRLSNLPSQAPATTADYFVEGYAENIGDFSWSMTLNLSPVYPYDDVLILDSATEGLLDTNILAL